MIGKTLAHYEITDLLGKGGMGEVYRARDTKLGREVALKFLPPELSDDPERCARFEREARTLANLQHPNVATIYGFEEIEGFRFLVMELVEGEDLEQRLRHRPIPVSEALDMACQIAAGIEAAHERDIVHRDLKPANIKITPDGEVKILDFGLARAYQNEIENDALDRETHSVTIAMTRAGTVLGTPAYMSPEQARGETLDRRTDVWAFGCVLYEMLTGQKCFSGDSITDVLASIVTKEPDWSLLPPKLPLRVHELLRQTLEKNPRHRLRDIGDIGLVIERVGADIAAPSPPASTGSKSSRPFIWGVMLVLLAAIAYGVITKPWTGQQEPMNLLSGATITRITDFPGSESSAAISPDGKMIACLSDRGGQFDVWVIPVGTEQPYNLTDGRVGGLFSPLRSVGFSHDGSEVWLAGSFEHRLRRMPLLGGNPRNWLGHNAISVSWSPDGNQVVYQTSDPGDPLIVANRDGSDRREILNSGRGYHQHFRPGVPTVGSTWLVARRTPW